MNAWLITNGFLRGEKFDTIYQWLVDAAKKRDVDLRPVAHTEFLHLLTDHESIKEKIAADDIRWAIFWDKDVMLARTLEACGLRLYNSARVIEVCDHKGLTHSALQEYGVPMPATVMCPMTFGNVGYTSWDWLDAAARAVRGYPLVVKACHGSFGAQVFLVKDREELIQRLTAMAGQPVILQQYISYRKGIDIRIQMVGREPVCAMIRRNPHDFRANITGGGTMEAYRPLADELVLAIKAAIALDMDFGGVDILFSKDGPLLCEVNSNAHFKNIYDCTGVNTADLIIDHILGKEQ